MMTTVRRALVAATLALSLTVPLVAAGPAATAATPEQRQQQKMMGFMMPVMMLVFFYAAPSGLNLYIMSSNVFAMLEQWRIRQHLANVDEKKEEEERRKKAAKKAGKKSWLQRKWDELAKEAEETRTLTSDRKKKKDKKPK